jgi:hypothetical protein
VGPRTVLEAEQSNFTNKFILKCQGSKTFRVIRLNAPYFEYEFTKYCDRCQSRNCKLTVTRVTCYLEFL